MVDDMRSVPDLDDLIAQVSRRADSGEPVDRLAEAVRLGNELGARADALVDHFVAEARDAGLSWAQIGSCLGVSKQAAQQQFVDPVTDPRSSRERKGGRGGFGSYTRRARQTVKGSVRVAQAMGCNFVGTEHLLLGMIDLGEGVGPEVLAAILPLADWRAAVANAVTVTPRRVRGRLPFTPLARAAMVQAATEAMRLGHSYVGTEHQLLALAAISDGIAGKVLAEHGADYERLKNDIVAVLGGATGFKAVGDGSPPPDESSPTAEPGTEVGTEPTQPAPGGGGGADAH